MLPELEWWFYVGLYCLLSFASFLAWFIKENKRMMNWLEAFFTFILVCFWPIILVVMVIRKTKR